MAQSGPSFSMEHIPAEVAQNLTKLEMVLDSDENLSDSEASDSEETLSEAPTTKDATKIKRGPIVSKLTPLYKGLMGEANLRLARGDVETARKMCFEVIRQIPNAYEPYLTLAHSYEHTGIDINVYKSYLTIASYLNPRDSSTWCRLADLSVESGNLREAISFYSKALFLSAQNVGDVDIHMKRLALAEKLGDKISVLRFKKILARHLPETQHETIITLVKEVCQEYHLLKRFNSAAEVLEIPFKRIPQYVTQDLINMMLELLLHMRRFSECLDIFVEFNNFKLELSINDEGNIKVDTYSMPKETQIDIRSKFIICVIKMGSFNIVNELIDSLLMEENIETIGDLYLDVAEVLMQVGKPDIALKLLVPLVKSKNYSLAAVWLKYAESLAACELYEQAVEGYFTVMALAPQHVEVLYPLAMILLTLNKKSEALEVMSQDLTSEKLDVAVLIEKMKLLKQIGDFEEYWKSAELLLSRHCIVLKNPEELRACFIHRYSDRIQKIFKIRMFRNERLLSYMNKICIREPTTEVEYNLYRSEILQIAKDRKEYRLFQKFAFMGLTSKRFEKYYDEIYLAATLSCLYNHDTYHGFPMSKVIVQKNQMSNLAWNLFNVVLQLSEDVRHNRFVIRYQGTIRDKTALNIIDANFDFLSGNFDVALKFFMNEFRDNKTPYVSFILGVILLQMMGSRNNMDVRKQLCEVVSYFFLNYAKTRSRDAFQEVCFNLGRLYQQLGVNYLSEHYYKLVLQDEGHLGVKYPKVLNLKRQAAYNLHLIYLNSENYLAARNVLYKYIVIE